MSATLSELKIGSLTLTPEFDPDVTSYAAATTNATNTITATASDTDSTILIKNGDTVVENGTAATWETGENTVTVKVTNRTETKTYTITVTKSDPDATLSALKIGSLTLTPTFDSDVTSYAASTTNATNTITATASDTDSTIVIKNGETVVENGSAATWETGENTVTVKVTNRTETKTYTITVTKSDPEPPQEPGE